MGQSRAGGGPVGNGFKCSNEFFGFESCDHLEYIFSEEDQVAQGGAGNQFEEAFFCTRRWSLWQPLKKSTLYGENSAEERVFWGLGGGTGAEMTSTGSVEWLPLWCRITILFIGLIASALICIEGERMAILFWQGGTVPGELRYFFSRAFSCQSP